MRYDATQSRIRPFRSAMQPRTIAAATLCCIGSASLSAQQPARAAEWRVWVSTDTALTSAITAVIGEVASRQRTVGLAAAVYHRGRVIFAAGQGLADIEHGVPVARDTRFQVASVTKPFTGLVLLKLVEAGRIDLDAPVQRYVPDFPRHESGEVTLRHLQAHLGGIRGYRPNERTPDFFTRHFTRATDALAVFRSEPFGAAPGERPIYSSYGYNLIAAAIEGAVGQAYSDVLAAEVIRPLGLNSTMMPDARLPIPNRSRSYMYRAPGNPATYTDTLFRGRDHDYSYNAGGGNILTTVEDLVRFGAAFLKPGFLSAESHKLAVTPWRPDAIQSFGMVVTEDTRKRRVLFTTGDIEAFQAGLTLWPDNDVVVAITSNTEGRGTELRVDLPRRIGLLVLDRTGPR